MLNRPVAHQARINGVWANVQLSWIDSSESLAEENRLLRLCCLGTDCVWNRFILSVEADIDRLPLFNTLSSS